jgi:hypothetical protein
VGQERLGAVSCDLGHVGSSPCRTDQTLVREAPVYHDNTTGERVSVLCSLHNGVLLQEMGPNFLPQAYANPRWLYFGFLGKQRTKGKCVSIGTLRNSVCQPPTNLLAEEMTMQADLPIAAIDASFTSLFCILGRMPCDRDFSLRLVGSAGGCLRTRN